ncbi:hypothetical protein [Prosthecobacter sp.]|uniref:hypothetical protein n=1 Tax=Prosthecobacter sp. TaxID=1965333 RepID=UPI00262C5F2A|nr:hypothetical protein [Prosthecobacter sp.]
MKLQQLLCSAIVLFTLTSCYVGPGYGRPIGRPVGVRPVGTRPIGRPIVLPHGASPYHHNGVRYYQHRGVWYRPHAGGHIIVPRPY